MSDERNEIKKKQRNYSINQGRVNNFLMDFMCGIRGYKAENNRGKLQIHGPNLIKRKNEVSV